MEKAPIARFQYSSTDAELDEATQRVLTALPQLRQIRIRLARGIGIAFGTATTWFWFAVARPNSFLHGSLAVAAGIVVAVATGWIAYVWWQRLMDRSRRSSIARMSTEQRERAIELHPDHLALELGTHRSQWNWNRVEVTLTPRHLELQLPKFVVLVPRRAIGDDKQCAAVADVCARLRAVASDSASATP